MSAPEIEIRPAQADDLPAIAALLNACQLPTDDLKQETLSTFFVAGSGTHLFGVAGFEVSDTDGLLRSLAVAPDARSQHLGERLVGHCESAARAAGIRKLYLLTTTAAAYLHRLGYADAPRTSVPPAIAAHPQFRGLCPASAQCLAKLLA